MKRKTAILICGFNNWGKTTVIQTLFNKSRFVKTVDHDLYGKPFSVVQHSNDDYNEKGFINAVSDVKSKSPSSGKNILAAFCPTKEPYNDSARILSKAFKGYDIHIIYLVQKWDNHAQLNISNIKKHYTNLSISHVPITATNLNTRQNDVNDAVQDICKSL